MLTRAPPLASLSPPPPPPPAIHPSICADNENQRNYQTLCRHQASGLEPWVGAIVSPYDQALESAVRGCKAVWGG